MRLASALLTSTVGILLSSSGSAFDPASLFASGENGVWFEPSPTTAFRSTTDLTPCAAGESCGFLLDKSQGAGYSGGAFTGLGSELVTNGTFDTDLSSWTVTNANAGNTIEQSAGKLSMTRNVSGFDTMIAAGINITGIAGQWVLISCDYTETDATTNGRLQAIGTPFFNQTFDCVTGHNQFVFFIPTGTTSFYIQATHAGLGAIPNTITFDNISVKELPGFHATQGTAAARPILRQTGGGVYYLEDDEVDDALNWTAPTDTDYTVARVNSSGTVTILTGQSLSGATDILLDPALVAYIAVDRALTAEETTGLTSYLEALA